MKWQLLPLKVYPLSLKAPSIYCCNLVVLFHYGNSFKLVTFICVSHHVLMKNDLSLTSFISHLRVPKESSLS